MKRFIITIILTIISVAALKGFYWLPISENGAGFLQRFDYKVFIIIVTILYMLIYKTVHYLGFLKIEESHSRIDIVFMCFVALFVIIPMSRIDDAEINNRENRVMAKYQPLVHGHQINFEYGSLFEEWFNDRFNFRDKALFVNDRLNRFINGKSISDKGMVGKDGWLFSKQYNAIAMFQNDNLFSDAELDQIKTRLYAFRDWAESRGSKLYVFIAPDKETVYPEYYPDNYGKVNSQSRSEQLMKFLEENTDVVFVNPCDELMAEKEKQVVYYKTGTHWNETGAYIGYKKLLNRIKQDFPSLEVLEPSKFNIKKRVQADLDVANLLMIDVNSEYDEADLTHYFYELKNPTFEETYVDFEDKDKGYLYRYVNKDKRKKLSAFIYTDSFFLMSREFAAQSFARMDLLFLGFGRNFNMGDENGEVVKEPNRDVIILATTERFLQRLLHLDIPKDE